MANLTGGLAESPQLVEERSGISDSLTYTWALPYDTLRADISDYDANGGSLSSNQPISELTETYEGEKALGFSDYFYHRIHVNPTTIAAGNLITAQTHTVEVWNAFFVSKTLASITESGTDGINITPQDPPPATFRPLEAQTLQVYITTEGPALIDASYTLSFTGLDPITIDITGQRIIAWTFAPDWSRPISERLEWKTDTLVAYDGTEQRIALRQTPRRGMEFDFCLDDNRTRGKFESLLYNWGAREWLFPIWWEEYRTTSTLTQGTTTISLPRASDDYVAGGNAIIMTNASTFEILEVDSVTGNNVTLARGLESDWPAMSRFMPAKTGRLQEKQQLTRFNGEVIYGTANVQFTDLTDTTAATETTYRGLPVLEQAPEWSRDIILDHERKMQLVDYGTGRTSAEDEAGMPFLIQNHNWTLDGKDAIDEFRAFLYARKGRFKTCWVPTFCPDIECTSTIGASDLAIDVAHQYLTKHLTGHLNRRDIRIELMDGTVFYRHISQFTEVDADTERVSINSSLGQIVQPSDIRRISWMMVARLDTDVIELAWRYYDWVDCSLNWRGVRYDI